MEIAAFIAIVVGLSQITKNVGLANKYIPLLNLLFGVVLGILFLTGDIKANVLQGLIIGLSASGLYDQSKLLIKE